MNYKAVLQYEGIRYNGWQRQSETDNTIQNIVENALGSLSGERVEVQGSGRTDAGTHARGQVISFRLSKALKCEDIVREVNRLLPSDILFLSCEEKEDRFHARLNAIAKVYCYRLSLGRADVFSRRYVLEEKEGLDIEKMREATDSLIGRYDFKGFSSDKRKKKSTVREIYDIRISENNGIVEIAYCGDGFLYNMVRILTGTLVEIGEGKRDIASIQDVLAAKDRSGAGRTLPPRGLTLERVFYDKKDLEEYLNK